MKRILVIALAMLLSACGGTTNGRRTVPTSAANSSSDLQGTWITDCISDDTGNYRSVVVFSGSTFSSFDKNFNQTDCSDSPTPGTVTSGTFQLTANGNLNWIASGKTTYDTIFMSPDKTLLAFGNTISNDPTKRPTVPASISYVKQ